MYIFSNEEDEKIAESSKIEVDSIWRGYNITPMFELLKGLNLSDVVNNYCDTKRGIYLKKEGVDLGINKAMLQGGVIHTLIERIFTIVRKNGFKVNPELIDYLSELKSDDILIEIIWDGRRLQELKNISDDEDDYLNSVNEIKEVLTQLIDVEIGRINKINDYSNNINLLDLEKYVDASIFYLGRGKIDLLANYKNKIGICDLKTGYPFGDNLYAKYQIALYSMMMENEYKVDINWGVVIFPFEKIWGVKRIREEPYKLIFSIDENIRQGVIKELGKINELLAKDELPPMCNKNCSSKDICEKGVII